MKKIAVFSLVLLLLSGCHAAPQPKADIPTEATFQEETCPPAETETIPIATTAETTLPPVPVLELTEEEKNMLLKLGMAERGSSECTECIALVMRTVLNRVESGRFGSSIRSVIFSQDQFTPVMDGTYDSAEPNQQCQEALDLVICGWDESQGALFYEWCEGESWHSKNLHLLFQHCDTRFYDVKRS